MGEVFEDCDPLIWSISAIQLADSSFVGDEVRPGAYFSEEIVRIRAQSLAEGLGYTSLASKTELWSRWKKLTTAWESVLSPTTSAPVPETDDETLLSSLINRPEGARLERQVRVDVARALNFTDCHLNIERTELDAKKNRLLNIVLRAMYSETIPFEVNQSALIVDDEELTSVTLQYTQGGHEICMVLLELGGDIASDQEIAEFCLKLISQRSFSLHSSLPLNIALTQILLQVSQILQVVNPPLLKSLIASCHSNNHAERNWIGDGSELHFVIPWLVTLFTHSVANFQHILQIWSILMALPPPFIIYLVAALVATHCGAMPSDMFAAGVYNSANSNSQWVGQSDSMQGAVLTALMWLQKIPYSVLFADTERLLTSHHESLGCFRFFDAEGGDALHSKLGKHTILPPAWAPCLGRVRKAVVVHQGAMLIQKSAISPWEALLRTLNQEYRIMSMPNESYSSNWLGKTRQVWRDLELLSNEAILIFQRFAFRLKQRIFFDLRTKIMLMPHHLNTATQNR